MTGMVRIGCALAAAFVLLALPTSAATRTDVRAVALAEIAAIEAQGFRLPDYALAQIDTWRQSAWTIHSPRPVQYVIVLDTSYDDARTRKHVAHEVAHVLMLAAGTHPPGDEAEVLADRFAACYGSPKAREYALRWSKVTAGDAECQTLEAMMKSK